MRYDMYNEKQKQEYVDLEGTNEDHLKRYFVRIAPKEKEYAKDITEMSLPELKDTLMSLNIRRYDSRSALLSVLRGYVNWAILNKKTNNASVIDKLTPESIGTGEVVQENMIGSPEHLQELFDTALDYENYENKSAMSELLIRLLYEGMTLEEIQSLKKADLDFDGKKVQTVLGTVFHLNDDIAILWRKCSKITSYEKKNSRAMLAKNTKNVEEYVNYELIDNKYLFRTIVTNKNDPISMITLDSLRKTLLAVFTAAERKTIPARNINYSGIFYKLLQLEKEGNVITQEVIAKHFRITYNEHSNLPALTRKWRVDYNDWKLAFGYASGSTESGNELFAPDETMKIENSAANLLSWNINQLDIQNKKGMIDFEFALQRGSVWEPLRNSLLIHSILIGFPIAEFYLNRLPDGTYEGLEGKQRNTAICDFRNGLYVLHDKTPPVKLSDGTTFSVAKHSFGNLPDELQNQILMFPLRVWWFDNAPLEDKVLFMQRINNGKPVTKTDLSRYKVKSRKLFIQLTKHMAISYIIREKVKAKLGDEDIVQDIWIASYVDNPSLVENPRTFVLEYNEVTDTQEQELLKAFGYMHSFYMANEKNKRFINKLRAKIHIVSLGYMGVLAVRNGISEDEFIQKATGFFNTGNANASVSDKYNKASGYAKPELLQARLNEMAIALGV